MRALIFIGSSLLAAPAFAHVGHMGEFAGHDHWVAGAALGVAAAISLWAALKGKKTVPQQDTSREDEAVSEDAEEAKA